MEEFLRDEAEDYNKEKMCRMIMEHDTYDYAKAEANVQSRMAKATRVKRKRTITIGNAMIFLV